MAFWVHVEKGYTIFIVYFSSFKSLESLESLARLFKKVLKSCETFKIQDFANAKHHLLADPPPPKWAHVAGWRHLWIDGPSFVY